MEDGRKEGEGKASKSKEKKRADKRIKRLQSITKKQAVTAMSTVKIEAIEMNKNKGEINNTVKELKKTIKKRNSGNLLIINESSKNDKEE